MKRILISGLTLALLTGGAMAQQSPAPAGANSAPPVAATPAPASMDADAGAPPPPPPPPLGGRGGPGGPGGPGAQLPPPPPPPPRGAHFRLTRGDATLDVKCADGESMKSCSDIALQLLDKLQTLPAGTTTTTGSSTPAPAAP